MATDREKDRTELRKEIKIAIFWRQLIGDFEYIKFNPDDMLRWYLALDMRGEEEVRALIDQRYAIGARRIPVLGLVGEAPHPPAWIVREWLETRHPKFPKWRLFFMSCSFVVIAGMFAPRLSGCQAMVSAPPTRFSLGPQPTTALPTTSLYSVTTAMPSAPIDMQPINTRPPVAPSMLSNGISPPTTKAQMGIPLSAGPAPAAGTTGPVNGGASGPAPTSSSSTGSTNSSGAPP